MKQVLLLSHARSNLLDCSNSCFVYTLLESKMSDNKGRPVGTGGIYKQRGDHKSTYNTCGEKQVNYMRNLSTEVKRACDAFFVSRNMPLTKGWKEQANEKRNKS